MNSMLELFLNSEQQLSNLSQRLMDAMPELLSASVLTDEELDDLAQVLLDKAFLFRHLKKNEFQIDAAVSSLVSFFQWRHETDASAFDYSLLSSDSVRRLENGFFIITQGCDRKDRPILYIKLAQVLGMSCEELRSHLQIVMEMCRKMIFYLNQEKQNSSNQSIPKVFQMSVLLDVQDFGFSHLNLEYLPCLREIFSSHFPQSFGSIYVLNYGWIHSGIWKVIKPLLTTETKDRLLFLDKKDLEKYISLENIPQAYGGTLQISSMEHELFRSNQVMMENNVLKLEIQKILDHLLIINSEAREMEEDVWFDASEHGYNIKVESAADLQLLLHSNTIRNKGMSVPMSRTGSSSRNLHYSNSFVSLRSISPDRLAHPGSPVKKGGDKGKRVLERILFEVSRAAHPGVGFIRGVFISFFDFGKRLLQRNTMDKPKGYDKYWRRGITILTAVTLTIMIVRRVQKRIAY